MKRSKAERHVWWKTCEQERRICCWQANGSLQMTQGREESFRALDFAFAVAHWELVSGAVGWSDSPSF